MSNYYVNTIKDDDGDHEVHKSGCSWLPRKGNREYLGNHFNCYTAVNKARRKGYTPANGCAHCSSICHTS